MSPPQLFLFTDGHTRTVRVIDNHYQADGPKGVTIHVVDVEDVNTGDRFERVSLRDLEAIPTHQRKQ